jgi:methylmalonyl-CoA mutase N-terminal domain/subunit
MARPSNPGIRARLRELRASRERTALEDRLGALEGAARSSDNLMPHILACAEAQSSASSIFCRSLFR